MSEWNAFQKAHKGQGLSRAEMSRLYQESKSATRSTPAPSFHTPDTTSTASRRPNAWNDFQRSVAGQNLSMQQKRQQYRELQARTAPMTPPAYQPEEHVWPPLAPMRFDSERATHWGSEAEEKWSDAAYASGFQEEELEWSTFRDENADRGWSMTRMAAEHRAATA